MILSRKLIVESPNYNIGFIKEQKNSEEPMRVYIEGLYMQHSSTNKNKRRYSEGEMIDEVSRYTRDLIDQGRAIGELDHSTSPEVKIENACHRILSLKPEGNGYIGRSLVMSTPKGKILEHAVIEDGVQIGMSTKALGQLNENDSDVNDVSQFYLIGVDAVHDPSCSEAFVNGILENKEFIISSDGNAEQYYGKLERGLSKYPSKHRDEINEHIRLKVQEFLKSL